jgi:hypothetical protein
VVMIHGGGFRAGDKASWEPEARRVADKGWVAFSIAYRLDEPTATRSKRWGSSLRCFSMNSSSRGNTS